MVAIVAIFVNSKKYVIYVVYNRHKDLLYLNNKIIDNLLITHWEIG